MGHVVSNKPDLIYNATSGITVQNWIIAVQFVFVGGEQRQTDSGKFSSNNNNNNNNSSSRISMFTSTSCSRRKF